MPVVQQAGAIAVRVRDDRTEFLIVTARRRPDQWIFPKGHIERRETPGEAAVRELEEEADVRGKLVGRVGASRFRSKGEDVKCTYYLIRAKRKGRPREGRQMQWLSLKRARAQLSFKNAQKLLDRAARMFKKA